MTTIHVQLDDATYERLRQKAAAAGMTPGAYVAERAREAAGAEPEAQDRLAGWLADEPQLADAIEEAAKRSRRERFGDSHASDDR